MINVMADNVNDDDICSQIAKSNSTSINSLKQIDLTQSNHQQQHQHQQHPHQHQLNDADHINNIISISSEDDSLCLLATNSSKNSQQNEAQNRKEKQQLIIATTLCFFFMFAELLGGYLAGSLAIMSDAAHLLSDCISFIVALLAIVWAKKSPNNHMTFGYQRIEVLGAIMSIFGIWLLTTFLFYFAFNRLMYQDFDIDADSMMIFSALGIVINIIMAFILHGEGLCCFKTAHNHHRHHNCSAHSPKHDQTYHNNNKMKFEYRPLINESADKNAAANWNASILGVKRGSMEHHDSVRSPNRSRSNSLNRAYAYANGHSSSGGGGSDIIRRNGHATTPSLSTSATNKLKEIIDLQHNECHHDTNEHNDEKSLIGSATEEAICVRGFVKSANGPEICPRHHYVHRDSSEHTPITSSDSEDLHDHHHHHNHRHSLVNHLHGNNHSRHSHDFASKNINIQAAVIHVIGDFVQSIGVFISAIIIKNYPNAKIADPVCTFVFSIIVMMTTCTIMKDSIGIILEAVPNSVNIERLKNDLKCIDGVRSIHSLNVWSLTVGWQVMSVHIVVDPFIDSSDVLHIATTIAQKGYNIKQCTIQIEKYRESECSEAASLANTKSHSIMAENDNSIINILA